MPTKKIYTKEFKEQAVQLTRKNGNISETVRRLGIHGSILRRWKMELEQNAEKAFPVQVRAIARMKKYGSYNERISD